MADEAQSILAPAQIDNSLKADAWQAFKDTANEREFGARLQTMGLPQNVKADLWEAKRRVGATPAVPTFQDAANQSKQQLLANSPLAPTERAMQQTMGGTPTFVDVPKGKKEAFEEAGQAGYQTGGKAGLAALSVPGMIANPAAAIGGLVGGQVGGYGAKKGAEALGASPDTADMAEGAGNVIGGTVGGFAGVKGAGSSFVKWLGASKTIGAKLLQQASAKAGSAPVEMSPATNEIVEEIVKQGKLGGTVPKVITDLLDRVGPTVRHAAEADAGPLTYDEARILQSNAGQMSAQEQMTLKGKLKYLIPQFAKSFGRDVQAAADQAGVGTEHAAGMREFANASSRDRTLTRAAKYVGIPAAAIAAEEGLRHLWK